MLRYFLGFILLIHGLIHFMGFAKAFDYGNMKQLTIPISKTVGIIWMVTALLFILAVVLFFLKKEYWWMVAIPAILLSQFVIIASWKDARFGTIANIILLLVVIAAWGSWQFENQFSGDVKKQMQLSATAATPLLTENTISTLPLPVQQYLRYCGAVNKPIVKNVKIVFDGQMRSKGKDWFSFRSVQYNFFDEPCRLFFMKGKMKGITVPGYHHYINKTAVMDVRLFGLFPVMKAEGIEMNKAETVTLFNDMCLMAPATLIDKRIQWQNIDSLNVKAIFTNGGISISALLQFNQQGQLINFISDDRYEINAKKQYRFSTPVTEYVNINGVNVLKRGSAVWHYPDGEFEYGRFILQEIEYNLK
jgi:hypothetical protein